MWWEKKKKSGKVFVLKINKRIEERQLKQLLSGELIGISLDALDGNASIGIEKEEGNG